MTTKRLLTTLALLACAGGGYAQDAKELKLLRFPTNVETRIVKNLKGVYAVEERSFGHWEIMGNRWKSVKECQWDLDWIGRFVFAGSPENKRGFTPIQPAPELPVPGLPFEGQYVEGGCFEDKPETLIAQALANELVLAAQTQTMTLSNTIWSVALFTNTVTNIFTSRGKFFTNSVWTWNGVKVF